MLIGRRRGYVFTRSMTLVKGRHMPDIALTMTNEVSLGVGIQMRKVSFVIV